MAQMLAVNKTLRELHLGKHDMTDTGVERLCEALMLNISLRYLDLRWYTLTYIRFSSITVKFIHYEITIYKMVIREIIISVFLTVTELHGMEPNAYQRF